MQEPILKINDGSINGYIEKDIYGNNFYSFEGIPYGKAPIKELRFKPPVPVEPWEGVLDATSNLNKGCYCRDIIINGNATEGVLMGSEDCLNLNIYMRQLPQENEPPKPVMVFIHGGAFITGSTKDIRPQCLMSEDVVLVTIHYRLGVLGFLCLEDPKLNVTGNSGLKDCVLALKWVRDNIGHFNGDKNNVTIFGHSAGGVIVNYLLLSPSSKGLFHKAIIQSGSVLNHWAHGQANNGRKLADLFNVPFKSDEEILKYLQALPIEKLYETSISLIKDISASEWQNFSPVVENPLSPEPFLIEHPLELLRTGKFHQVPIMLGYTDYEGYIFSLENTGYDFKWNSFNKAVPCFLNLKEGSKEYADVEKKILDFYFGKNQAPEKHTMGEWMFISDVSFIRGIIKLAEYLREHNNFPVYFYCISVMTKLGCFGLEHVLTFPGPTHSSELCYLFPYYQTDPTLPEGTIEDLTRRKFLKLWADFARYGNPTFKKDQLVDIDWLPSNKERLSLLDIGEKLRNRGFENETKRMKFLDEIFQSQECSKYY